MKKYLLAAIFFFQTAHLLAQSVGSVVRSKTIYSGNGINISYTVTYYGNGDCNDRANPYYKKYRLDFSASNTSSSTVTLYGSRIDLDDNLGNQDYCRSGIYILLGSYPGFEEFGTLVPNESRTATKNVYMLASSNDLPYVTYNIIPKITPAKQSQSNTGNQTVNNVNNTSVSNQNSVVAQNIQEAIRKFNSLINPAAAADQQKATQLQTNVQQTLNSTGNTDSFKLTIVNNAIKELEDIIARGNKKLNNNSSAQTNTSIAATPKTQNDLTDYYRSKADLERQMREENNWRQQQATQTANKRQQFVNVYNQGVKLGNTGKYAEAAAMYQQAIGLATSDADRQTAQNAYNKISKANDQQQALNKAMDLINQNQDVSKQQNFSNAQTGTGNIGSSSTYAAAQQQAEGAINTVNQYKLNPIAFKADSAVNSSALTYADKISVIKNVQNQVSKNTEFDPNNPDALFASDKPNANTNQSAKGDNITLPRFIRSDKVFIDTLKALIKSKSIGTMIVNIKIDEKGNIANTLDVTVTCVPADKDLEQRVRLLIIENYSKLSFYPKLRNNVAEPSELAYKLK